MNAKKKKEARTTRPSVDMINREISWLAFNDRVLQEAADESVPLIERARFLGIFSNNRDEFFRVRVANLRRITMLGKKGRSLFGADPQELLDRIQEIVVRQEKKFQKTYRQILKELRQKDIFMIDENHLSEKQHKFVADYFLQKIRPALVPILMDSKTKFPFLREKVVYLAIKLYNKKTPDQFRYSIMEIPSDKFSRFVVLPQENNQKFIMLLDDIIRSQLHHVFALFDYDTIESYTIKITRDAELDIDEDISISLIDKLSKSLKNRKVGLPTRFVYDGSMPEDLYNFLVKKMKLNKVDNIIPGGRYHNFKDFINFPSIGAQKLRYNKLKPIENKHLKNQISLLAGIAKKDVLLYYPYDSFTYVIDLLREAAIDPAVESIKIALYRVAKNSHIVNALTNAVKNGKDVTVVVELRARFDEEANIYWSNELQDAGVKVIFGVPGLKVHAKILLISRKEGVKLKHYAHIGTGNFHEGTAGIYTDHTLLTADDRITNEVAKIFEFFNTNYKIGRYSHLILSPYNTRRRFIKLIHNEINNAKAGKEAWILVKLNNLQDPILIRKLYDASKVGVKIRMIIRGICTLIPGVKGMSENIEVRSIVDRFLEHSRVFCFCSGGNNEYYISSADWMGRNLDRRIEVTIPIYNENLQQELRDVLEMQWKDNVKARLTDEKGSNQYHVGTSSKKFRSQIEIHKYLTEKNTVEKSS